MITATWRKRLKAAHGDERAEDEERDGVGEQVAEPGVQERGERDANRPRTVAADAPPVEGVPGTRSTTSTPTSRRAGRRRPAPVAGVGQRRPLDAPARSASSGSLTSSQRRLHSGFAGADRAARLAVTSVQYRPNVGAVLVAVAADRRALALDRRCLIAAITASAAAAGTSTGENRSAISIAPMSRPLRSDSLAIAPTRSPGGAVVAAGADEQPRHGAARVAAARWPRPARAGRSPRSPLGRSSRGTNSGISTSSAAAPWPRARASPPRGRPRARRTRRRQLVDARRGSGRGRRRRVRRAGRQRSARAAGPQVGDGRHLLDRDLLPGDPLDVASRRCSRGSASVMATPSRPARPTRPMRCT